MCILARMRKYKIYTLLFFTVLLWPLRSAYAASFVRDAEVEYALKRYSRPIFEAAKIPPESVRIFIINDPSINAFVAGGLNLFIHTGLILKADDPGMLIGVIAHETGHIAGAHLARLDEKSEEAHLGSLLSAILGAAVIAGGGGGDAGAAVIQGGQQAFMRDLLAFYRGNEEAADEAAISYLETSHFSPQGMLKMFELLRRNEAQHIGPVDPYARTHPLTRERIARVRAAVDKKVVKQDKLSVYDSMHQRMLAKLRAFLIPPEQIFTLYPPEDKSDAARYARAIAYFRQSNLQQALQGIDALIASKPNDAFLYDTKGQFLFEHGRVDEAITTYERANALLPGSPLILFDLGRAYIASGKTERLADAVSVLRESSRLDSTNATVWRHLAIAYGKQGELGLSHLALAEEASLNNTPKEMRREAELALSGLQEGTPAHLRAKDLQALAKRLEEEG